jgi:hypothetical protein
MEAKAEAPAMTPAAFSPSRREGEAGEVLMVTSETTVVRVRAVICGWQSPARTFTMTSNQEVLNHNFPGIPEP